MKRIIDVLFSFFQGFARWLGMGLALAIIVIAFSTFSNDSPQSHFKVKSLPTKGFEVSPWTGQNAVLLLHIDQIIGSPALNAQKIGQILQVTQNGSLKGKVKAILLDINSGGGESNNSEEIFHTLLEYKKLYKTPIYAHVSGFCFSGAYMISCAADKILTTDYASVGSVGVKLQMFNISNTLKRLGIQSVSFKQGHGKDALNAYEPLNDEDKRQIEPLLEATYERFLEIVSSSRPMLSKQDLREIYGARIFSAAGGLEAGYVDAIGVDRASALSQLASKAGLEEGYALIELQPVGNFSEWMISDSALKYFKTFFGMLIDSFSQVI